ncbi:phage tail assembly chaperone [Bradyrhizobium sp. BR 10289]|uniref:phage tail assembly chaperone n=1 Tax=Bradyrhizobium sp. BR 10289 TaxID=2749993 RepID=UPI001C64982F|nr:phage tail assembly chaperone [Bradyrhizobium sp. BR 10289]MBW7968109.1 hypothetical protein [Bradyrhizobium sp. BR 10289]
MFGFGSDDDGGSDESHFPGCKVAFIDNQYIDPRTQRFDPQTGRVVAKDRPDPPPDRMWDVRATIRMELEASDKFVNVEDFRVGETDRAAWIAYRAALRDASKGRADWGDVLAAIPNRPDGSDPASRLRLQLIADRANEASA